MKKLIIITLLFVLFIACSENKKNASDNDAIYIGIAKFITHPALDYIEKGIQDELTAQGFTNIRYNLQNANGEMSTASSIANMFKNENVDIVVGIATPTAVALAKQINDRPVIFSAVTDPVGAGLRTTLEPENTYIVGVSNMAPVRKQIQLILDLNPNVKKIGHIYSSGEMNSIATMKLAQQVCNELGIELVLSTVTNTSEVKQAAEVVAPKVDAIYVSHDNAVVAALSGLTATATKYGVPVISADPSSAPLCNVTVAYGVDDYKTGVATGEMIAEILRGKKLEELPVRMMNKPDELSSYVNKELVEKFKLQVPDYVK